MRILKSWVLLGLVGWGVMAETVRAQAPAVPADTFSALKKSWLAPAEPMHVVGPIYFVGTRGLGVWLITTPAGHILLGGAMPQSTSLIVESIRKLGFKVEDIKILLSNHAHFDHVGTLAEMKKLTGAQVMAMEPDVALLASGGKLDYLFAKDEDLHFPPVTVDRALKNGDVIELGGVELLARLAAGHTRGCAIYSMVVGDGGKSYKVVFADGTSVNPGTKLVHEPSYPGILEDYRKTFRILEQLKPDIFLAYHVDDFGFAAKRAKFPAEGAKAFVDPEGYRKFIEGRKEKFEGLVAKEEGK